MYNTAALYVSKAPVTLKLGHGYRNWEESATLSGGFTKWSLNDLT